MCLRVYTRGGGWLAIRRSIRFVHLWTDNNCVCPLTRCLKQDQGLYIYVWFYLMVVICFVEQCETNRGSPYIVQEHVYWFKNTDNVNSMFVSCYALNEAFVRITEILSLDYVIILTRKILIFLFHSIVNEKSITRFWTTWHAANWTHLDMNPSYQYSVDD